MKGYDRNSADLATFWDRVRALTPTEITALAAVADWSDRVPHAFDQVAGLEYANDAYLASIQVFREETPAAQQVDPTIALGAELGVASKGAAVAAHHRLSARNLAILEDAWRQAGLD